ncbi:MAG: quinol:cytochrome c oxidoreductase iron-sulfur protein precursor [Myxococcales bacterium]|nr:quinol:cytochrome c oxidoreductase iron-sulfur protein precursor [Myxococcales bacterium]
MSCDDNKEARGADRAKRLSLPVVKTVETPAPKASRFWRSIAEKNDPTAAKAIALGAINEFAPGVDELPEDSVSRRGFMQLMGVSTALATVGAACAKPHDKIVPFVRRPEEMVPGNPLHFATAFSLDGYASGLVVTSHEGRPTKVEGNPDHADTGGATTAFEQALILGLYDNDRLKELRSGGEGIAWRGFLAAMKARAEALATTGGKGLRFLVEPSASPLLGELRRRVLARFPSAKFVSYSSATSDGADEGPRLAYGQPLVARQHLDKAQVILSLDADFLGEGPDVKRLSREFSSRREPGADMNRLYVVEPALTTTGAMADHRLRLRGSEVASFAASLTAELAGRSGLQALGPLGGLPKGASGDPKWIKAVANDLERNRGRAVVIAGRRQPAAVHALAAALNAALGNVGTAVSYVLSGVDAPSGPKALGGLAEDIAAGTVDTLVITASNPVYTAPVDFKLAELLKRVPMTIYHGLYADETAAVCHTVIPAAHPLESWGDARAVDGTASIVQPLIAPLWGGVTETQVLAAFLGEGDVSAHELVRRFWQGQRSGDQATAFEGAWEKWLADGVLPGTAAVAANSPTLPELNVQALAAAVGPLLGASTAKADGLELGFVIEKLHDGRYANNAWLLELPHAITKVTWENPVMMSEATAKAQGVETGDIVALQLRERSVEGPVLVVPGHVDDAVTVALGYGRASDAESVGKGVGFNVGTLRASDAFWFDRGLKLSRTGDSHKFAITQEQWTMAPDGRTTPPPAVDATLAEILNERSEFNEDLAERRGPLPAIHTPVEYSKPDAYGKLPYKWGMSIDLNKCTGCSACVVACQAENNIPVVGQENVRKGRHMQWIRIDRYYTGTVSEPEIINQPLGCQQCETAPCEYVCPVNATVHSDEGLNEMVYNRCIGTRYCSNNCPYKARRFNFLNYTGDVTASAQMGMNPDVTVRTRGIMEKCTYCVQRIERKRIETRQENGGVGRQIQDGELQTACQQGCPSRAIEFGSLNDPNAKVTKLHADSRRYDLLHEIGTRPRTAYLARVRNLNPELAAATKAGE